MSQEVRPDGVSAELEEQLRNYGAGLIQGAGALLKLPQLVRVRASALYQRFYSKRTFAEFEARAVASASLALACKLEEEPRPMKDVILMVHRIQMRALQEDDGSFTYSGRPVPTLDITAKQFADSKKETLRAERFLFRELGFDGVMFLDSPHRHALLIAQALKLPQALLQRAWNYLNDSMRTKICCGHDAEPIALASILLAARVLEVKLPSRPPWWEAFGVQFKLIEGIAKVMQALYEKPLGVHVHVPRKPPPLSCVSKLDLTVSTSQLDLQPPAKSPSDEETAPADSQPQSQPPAPGTDEGSQKPADEPAVPAAPAVPSSQEASQPPSKPAPPQSVPSSREEERKRPKEREEREKARGKEKDRPKEKERGREREQRKRSRSRKRSASRRRKQPKAKRQKCAAASSLSGSESSSRSRGRAKDRR